MSEDPLKRKAHSCQCTKCRRMCMVSPCFPTPYQAKAIIDAGFGDAMKPSIYVDPIGLKLWPIIAPKFDSHAGCIFFHQGKCMLHDLGLKPIEGQLAHHDDDGNNRLRLAVCRTWKSKAGIAMIRKFADAEDAEYFNMEFKS